MLALGMPSILDVAVNNQVDLRRRQISRGPGEGYEGR